MGKHSSEFEPVMPASRDIFSALKPLDPAGHGQVVVVNFAYPSSAQDKYVTMDLQALQIERFRSNYDYDLPKATVEAADSIFTLAGAIGPNSPKRGRKSGEISSDQEPQHPFESLTRISERFGNEGIVLLNLALPGIEDVAPVIAKRVTFLRSTEDQRRVPAVGIIEHQGGENLISKRDPDIKALIGDTAINLTVDKDGGLALVFPDIAERAQRPPSRRKGPDR
jgi:hypothetical protein